MNKIFNLIKENIIRNYKIYLIYIIVMSICLVRFDYYVYSPGGLINLDDRINIDSDYKQEGSFNLTYVSAKSATLPVILLCKIIPSWDLVSINESRIENESNSDIVLRNKIYLKETSYDAVIAAFNEAKLSYDITNIYTTVTYVYDKSDTDIKVGDIIKEVNGTIINEFDDLVNEVVKYKENDVLDIKVLRNEKIVNAYAKLYKDENGVKIGISLSEVKSIKTNPDVNYIFKDNESGSSRGLMCALYIYNKITEDDLTNGFIISGTGSIDEYGNVGKIDGVKYKLSGAVKNKADVFIVPSENYEEAIKVKNENNYNIEIIKADNLHNVISKLIELKNRA